MSFNCIVVVGDGKGHVGIGLGKANEVASAVNKAKEVAKKNIFKTPVIKGTIPHRIDIKYGSVKLMLKPASPGTGIIAGGTVRAVLEQVGITNILTKNTGSTNAINVVRAVEKALKQSRDPLKVARQRGITMKELFN
jgi:small subunit ribosomal protein S5